MARPIKNRPTEYRIAIIGEGETEWYYFTSMRQSEKFKFKVEPELPKHSDYRSIINTARKKRDEGYDQVFCVLDLDRILANETERQGYYQEKSKNKSNTKITFIESMPCIELWFLLHFCEKYSSKIYLNFEQILIPLRHYINNYEKTGAFFKNTNFYNYLNTAGNPINASIFSSKLIVEKEKSDNPFFNFSDINKMIMNLKNI